MINSGLNGYGAWPCMMPANAVDQFSVLQQLIVLEPCRLLPVHRLFISAKWEGPEPFFRDWTAPFSRDRRRTPSVAAQVPHEREIHR
jgi:hypothetical protein